MHLAQRAARLLRSLFEFQILNTVRQTAPAEIPESLVNKANGNGGGDNITVVMITG